MISVHDIVKELELVAPPAYQESYDNSGLLVGTYTTEVSGVLLCLDITEEIVEEAIAKQCNLIVCHHPIVFSGLKRFNGNNMIERCIIKAIKKDIAIYASHTNMDAVQGGVNDKICEKLNLQNVKVLDPIKNHLLKLTVFVPTQHVDVVKEAMFTAGAGSIGEYDGCSFSTEGIGTFRASENATPYVGKIGELHREPECRVEVVVPKHLKEHVVGSMLNAHPYEEVAYDIVALQNDLYTVGIGRVGELPEEVSEVDFLKNVKEIFGCGAIRHTALSGKPVKRIALCGGSGASLMNKAIGTKADVFLTADFKYHQFFESEGRILVADIGHYESEQYTKDVFYEILTKKFPNFAVRLTELSTNPVNYFV